MTSTLTLGSCSSIGNARKPEMLYELIDDSTWNVITRELGGVQDTATTWTCLGECGFCILTGFFCIFLCHPCIANMVTKQQAEEACRKLNRLYFENKSVLWYSNDQYMLNMSPLTGPTSQPAPVHAEAMYHHEAPIAAATLATEPPAYSASRTMQVTLPADCKPGSLITVSAPTGETLQITVPQNAEPGSVIMVNY